MKCQNCGNNDANVRYTQIINGVKKQMNLCDECAKELGIDKISLDMPIGISNIWDEMFDMCSDMYDNMLSTTSLMDNIKMIDAFNQNMDLDVEDIQKEKETINNMTAVKDRSEVREDIEKFKKNRAKRIEKENSKIEILKKRLEKEIQEERFEDAAKTRDEIKKLSE